MVNATKRKLCAALVSALVCTQAAAETFKLQGDDSVVGKLHGIKSKAEYSLVDVARYFDLGYNEITAANRDVNVWLPGDDTVVLIPSRYVLPDTPREGIVLNLPEMRLYHYREGGQAGELEVVTHPVGIGRESWETPTLATTISTKKVKPSWRVPESIRAEYLAKGKPLPAVVEPGPENPLGEYAMRLGDTAYLIHGTNKPSGIGMRVSHGCIRLYPEDIESLFAQVEVGTQVRIVDQAIKAGLSEGRLYLEVHPAIDDDITAQETFDSAREIIARTALGNSVSVDWDRVTEVLLEANGIPTAIGATAALNKSNSWTLIAGSFAAEPKAASLVARLGEAQLDSRTWKVANRYQVEVGPFADVHQADYARKLIRRATGILALKIPPG